MNLEFKRAEQTVYFNVQTAIGLQEYSDTIKGYDVILRGKKVGYIHKDEDDRQWYFVAAKNDEIYLGVDTFAECKEEVGRFVMQGFFEEKVEVELETIPALTAGDSYAAIYVLQSDEYKNGTSEQPFRRQMYFKDAHKAMKHAECLVGYESKRKMELCQLDDDHWVGSFPEGNALEGYIHFTITKKHLF